MVDFFCKKGSVLSTRGYNVLKEHEDVATIMSELTVTPFTPMMKQQSKPNILYLESESRIYVPKYYGLKKWGCPEKNKLGDGKEVNLNFTGSLREEQLEPVSCLLNACNDPKKMGGILNVFCGGGKTTMALYVLAQLGRKALIIVHKDFLLNQWAERIRQFLPEARVGQIKAKVIDVTDKDIVIASLQSLSMKEYPESMFADFGTVVVDEVHHTSAEVFSKALRKVSFKYTIGLSATIKRKDGLSKVFVWYLGDVVFKAAKRVDHVMVQIVPFDSPCNSYSAIHTIMRDKPNVSRMINNICEFNPRNQVIINAVHRVLEKEPGRKMLILSDRRAHLLLLQQQLEDKYATGVYIGGCKLADCDNKQIILATFAIASEGYDQPGLDTLVLASPRSDVVQSVGRILRDKANDRKHVPLVIDIWDMFSLFVSQGKKRQAFYKSCEYDIVMK
jgi:superfamily II DNA or RNA helicase